MDADDAAGWVARTRRARGLTQSALSAAAGVSLATVQNIEAGTANPALGTLRRVFGALGLRLDAKPVAADWDLLASAGLPLAGTRSSPSRAPSRDLADLVTQAALELSVARNGAQRQRQREMESLQALLLALRHHFPSFYERRLGRVPVVRDLVPRRPSGRVIKLARVARARLAEIL